MIIINTQDKTSSVQVEIGVTADHAGFQLKDVLVKMLFEANYKVINFGDSEL